MDFKLEANLLKFLFIISNRSNNPTERLRSVFCLFLVMVLFITRIRGSDGSDATLFWDLVFATTLLLWVLIS
eukprot:UN06778